MRNSPSIRALLRISFVGAVLASVAAISVTAVPSADASADGCTSAPGPAATQHCIVVHGSGLHVDNIVSNYYYFPQAGVSGDNVCDRHHEVRYYLTTGLVVRDIDPPGCLYSAAAASSGDYVSFPVNKDLAANTQVCTRAKNSATDQEWTPYACKTIIP